MFYKEATQEHFFYFSLAEFEEENGNWVNIFIDFQEQLFLLKALYIQVA